MVNKLEGRGVTAIQDACLDYLLGSSDTPPASVGTVEPATLRQYEGYYEFLSSRSQFTAFMDILLSGVTLFVERDTLWMKTFIVEAEALLPVNETRFRTVSEPSATMAFISDQSSTLVLTGSRGYYERGPYWFAVLRLVLFVGAVAAAVSTLVYALYWVPLCLIQRIFKKGKTPPYLRIRILPLASVVSLLVGVVAFE